MNMKNEALGIIETYGLAAAIICGDEAVKSANVTIIGREGKIGKGLISTYLTGDVESVKSAVEIAGRRASALGLRLVASLVIPRPDDALQEWLSNEMQRHAQEDAPVADEPIKAETPAPVEEAPVVIPEPTSPPVSVVPTAKAQLCNLCGDPACSRKRGEPRRKCIHYAK